MWSLLLLSINCCSFRHEICMNLLRPTVVAVLLTVYDYLHESRLSLILSTKLLKKTLGNILRCSQLFSFRWSVHFCSDARRLKAVWWCYVLQESGFHLYALYNKNKPKSDELMTECGSEYFKVSTACRSLALSIDIILAFSCIIRPSYWPALWVCLSTRSGS